MKKELTLVVLPLVLLIGSSLGQQKRPCPLDNFRNVNVTFDDVRKTSTFALDLFKEIKNAVPTGNIFISPYSVWSALTIAYFGAEGRTLTQLQNALKLDTKDRGYKTQRLLSAELARNKGVQLQEANRAYFTNRLRLEPCFQRVEFFDVQQSDFTNPARLAQEINGFVSRTTNGLISQIVGPQDLALATFVLVNAVYFKGLWEQPFDKQATRLEDFFCNPGRSCGKVEMMSRSPSSVSYVNNTNLGAEVISLPYLDSSVSMLLFLPWENVNTVEGVVDRLDLRALGATVSNLKKGLLKVKFPRFKLEQTLVDRMKAALGNLGITDLFSRGADLSAFTNSLDLNADVIIHKAVVDVTEEGTEAAAATAIFDTRFGGPRVTPQITFNRPFVFLIVDTRLGIVLFSGIFRNPPL
ncbi:leukocyte elastase inhibitor A-like [Oratosquilla oratoria]|uniref:leukocyte elastase inhibitor A-like n=1 Tax=Oratosquilla oratoria TaxID=337810 RepID=UPI003F76987E